MNRKIIEIDQEKCNGCGLCVSACHEGAIGLEGGKAKLLRDDYCDGLGNCLPVCPTGAISFTEREAPAYDAEAVKGHIAKHATGGCPGAAARAVRGEGKPASTDAPATASAESELRQWPVQIKLVPAKAPFFDGASLLVAADCAAYAYADFHARFMKNKITVIGCPKLDDVDYTEKLAAILSNNAIKSVTVVRMEVPCCGGLANAAIAALKNCGKMIPWRVAVISTDGRILPEE